MNPWPVKVSEAYDPNDSTRRYFELDISHDDWDNGCIMDEAEAEQLAFALLMKLGWSVNGRNGRIESVTPRHPRPLGEYIQ